MFFFHRMPHRWFAYLLFIFKYRKKNALQGFSNREQNWITNKNVEPTLSYVKLALLLHYMTSHFPLAVQCQRNQAPSAGSFCTGSPDKPAPVPFCLSNPNSTRWQHSWSIIQRLYLLQVRHQRHCKDSRRRAEHVLTWMQMSVSSRKCRHQESCATRNISPLCCVSHSSLHFML